ncbi:MAG: hypothetical protein ABIR66_05635 [Saprospiraceae bacterium]
MKIKRWLILALLSGIACNRNGPKLTTAKYTDIILDLQVAETLIIGSPVKNKDSLRNAIHRRICEIYGFKDVKTLKARLEPLQSDPELMLEITKIMSKRLDALADSAIVIPTQ